MIHSKKKVKIIAAISATVVAFQISFMPVSAERKIVFSNELLQQRYLHQQYLHLVDKYPPREDPLTQKEAYSSDYADMFLKTEQKKFPNGKYWNSKNPDTWTDEPCDHANGWYRIVCTGFQVKKVFESGYTGNCPNTAYQCAGFASKLAYDYFDGCNYWVRQNYSSGFQFRVGDQIRVKDGGEEHSIFVTKVNNPWSLTIADCNADDQCGIRWGVSVPIINNKLCLPGFTGSVVYITRPAMYGDVNGDSRITIKDIKAIMQIVLDKYDYGSSDKNAVKKAADLDHNGVVNRNDLELAKIQFNSNGYVETQGFFSGSSI